MLPEQLARLPSLGWITAPSPVTLLPALAGHLGLGSLVVKRDDRLAALHGGTEARALELLLAAPPFRDAPVWAAVGRLGSGHLAACSAAARKLDRSLQAHTVFEPLASGVLERLAFVASGPGRLHYHGSRLELALRRPSLLTRVAVDGIPIIPGGATLPAGIAGVVRAGFELAAQLESGLFQPPQAIYVALGSGGTVAGLALGLGLAGVRTELRAVATAGWLSSLRRLQSLIAAAARWLREHGVEADPAKAVKIRVVRSQLGRGHAAPTAQSLAAVELLRTEDVALEPVHTGKAFAALLADAAARSCPQHVLFWSTGIGAPLPHDPAWRERLPPRLGRLLDRATTRPVLGRRLVLAGGLAAAGALAVSRLTGYPPTPGWNGAVLRAWEAQVIAAAAGVLTGAREVEGLVVAANVDRFLVPMPPGTRAEIHQLLALVEHGTTPLGLRLSRFTSLAPDAREAFLLSLDARGWLLAQAFRGLRDLVLMGSYQDSRTWPVLGYRGPWPKGFQGPESGLVQFDTLRAPAGATLKSSEPQR